MTLKMWWHRQFDTAWVKCENCNCRAEFTHSSIAKKRKCPKCKMDNKHCFKGRDAEFIKLVADNERMRKALEHTW